MKLYAYRAYSPSRQIIVDQGSFYAKSRDTMRARIAREQLGNEVSVFEVPEKPSQMKDSPKFIGRVLSLATLAPTWYTPEGDIYSFNRITGKLYGKKRWD